jgi:glycine/D-amino acid oxidase-like deaminating enzyme
MDEAEFWRLAERAQAAMDAKAEAERQADAERVAQQRARADELRKEGLVWLVADELSDDATPEALRGAVFDEHGEFVRPDGSTFDQGPGQRRLSEVLRRGRVRAVRRAAVALGERLRRGPVLGRLRGGRRVVRPPARDRGRAHTQRGPPADDPDLDAPDVDPEVDGPADSPSLLDVAERLADAGFVPPAVSLDVLVRRWLR